MITLDEARPFLEKALSLAGNTHTIEDVRKLIEEKRLQFWPGVNSAIITEIIEYPQKRTLHFFLAGGNLAELEAMYPIVEQFGRDQGCTAASTSGRPGWERTFLKREGWTPRTVVMTKEL
jgi:DNA polymerase/3'-5' exonuclease PolX